MYYKIIGQVARYKTGERNKNRNLTKQQNTVKWVCCFSLVVLGLLFLLLLLLGGGCFTYLFMFLTRVFSQQQQQIPFTYVQTKKQNCVTQNHQPKSISLTQNYQHKSMNQPSQHAGSDPEVFWLWPVMAVLAQLAARISPDCICQIRLLASISVPKKAWIRLCKTDPDLIWMAL